LCQKSDQRWTQQEAEIPVIDTAAIACWGDCPRSPQRDLSVPASAFDFATAPLSDPQVRFLFPGEGALHDHPPDHDAVEEMVFSESSSLM
jgi:hypothetical protein